MRIDTFIPYAKQTDAIGNSGHDNSEYERTIRKSLHNDNSQYEYELESYKSEVFQRSENVLGNRFWVADNERKSSPLTSSDQLTDKTS